MWREGGLVLKVDFAKAYDNVDWTLAELGCGARWITWIHSCIATATLAVLVNGSPTDFFQIEKGFRQGDALSPLLFNICVYPLSSLLNQLLLGSEPCGVKVGEDFFLNHLQFVEDMLIFCDNNMNQL